MSTIKSIIEKIWLCIAALCLVATLSAFVAVTASHQLAEESSSELVELEECEAVTHRRERRPSNKEGRPAFQNPAVLIQVNLRLNACDPSFNPMTERDYLNGTGSYLQL